MPTFAVFGTGAVAVDEPPVSVVNQLSDPVDPCGNFTCNAVEVAD